MADFIGRALVQVRADTTGFQADARKQIKNALDPIKATVNVTPTTVGFQTELRKQIKNAIATAGKFEVPVTPELTTFRQRFAQELRREPASVPVVPDMALFRAQLEEKVATINRGLLVKIPVVAGTEADFIPGKERGGGGGKVAEEDKEATAAAKARAEAEGRLKEVERTLGPIEKSRAEATALVNRALKEGLDDEERANLLRDSLAASSTSLTKTEIALAAARKAGDRELVKSLATTQARVVSEQKFTKQQLQSTALTSALTKATQSYTSALAIEVKTLGSAAQVQEARTALRTADKRITDLLTKSEFTLTKAQIEQLGGMQAEIRTRQQLVAAQGRQIKSQAALSGQEKLLARGAGATGLSLLGVRGATLAASGAFLVGAAAVATFAKSVFSAAQLETSLNVLAETSNATAEQLQRASEAAIQLGEDITLPGVTATDAAEAFTTLAKAGLSVEDALSGARGVLQLATAAQITNAEATELVASALNAFSLSGEKAVRVADLLANAANAAQGSISDMGIAMQQSAAVGRQVGLSLEDLTVFLTILAKSGLRGSDAGTSLRTALIRLINPTDKAKEKIEELGIQIRDAQGNLRVDIFQQLAAATANLSPAARDAALALLGGQDALRAFTILGRQSIQDLLRFRKELRQQGSAADLAAARTKGLQGSALALANTFQALGTSLGQRVDPALTGLTDGITSTIQALSQSEGIASAFNATFAGIGQTFNALGAILTTLGPIVLNLAGAFGQLGAAIGGLPILASLAAFKFGPIILGSLSNALVLASGRWKDMGNEMKLAQIKATSAGGSFSKLGFTLRSAGAALAGFVTSATGLTIAASVLVGGLIFLATRASATEKAVKSLRDATDSLAGSMTRANTAARDLLGAQRGADTGKLAVQQAILAKAQAKAALAGSNAAQGSIERKQLELNLALATQNVTFAVQDQRLALSDLRVAQEENRAATEAQNEARKREADSINKVIDGIQKQVKIAKAGGRTDLLGGRSGSDFSDAEIEARGREKIIELIREQANESLKSDDAQERGIGRRISLIDDLIRKIGTVPTDREIQILMTTPNLREALGRILDNLGITADQGQKKFIDEFIAGMTSWDKRIISGLEPTVQGLIREFLRLGEATADSTVDGFKKRFAERQQEIIDALEQAGRNASGRLKGLEEQANIIAIEGGGPGAELANLRSQRVQIEAELAAVLKRQGIEGATPSIIAERRRLRGELANITTEIENAEKAIADDARSKADDIKRARDDADQAVVDAFSRGEERVQNLLIRAQGTEGLKDDIKFKTALRTILLNQIKRAQTLIKNLEARRDFIRETKRRVLDLTNQIKQDQKALNEQLKKDAQERLQRIQESIQLDIEFASTRENIVGEIRARQRLIANLRKQQRKVKEGTVEWKRLRNAIAEEQKAIEELRGQKKDENKALASLQFEFLQAQKGFFANFFGNVLPLGSTSGLVGNVETGTAAATAAAGATRGGKIKLPHGAAVATGPQGPLSQAVARAEGRGGPTRGQAATEVELLRQVVTLLSQIAARDKNPEAKRSRIHAGGRMETV